MPGFKRDHDACVIAHSIEAAGPQYAEVCFMPNAPGFSRTGPDYRFLAVREPLRNPPLPGTPS